MHDPFEPEDNQQVPGGSVADPTSPETNADLCHPDTVYFVNQILPLLNSSCAQSNCHNRESAQDGVVLIDYQTIVETGDVRPFDLSGSDLYEVLVDDDEEDRMPPSPQEPLSETQIALIATWINQGAKNNSCVDANCETNDVSFSKDIEPVINDHCVGCHSGSNPSGNIDLQGYDKIKIYADNDRLFGSIAHLDGYKPMPQNLPMLEECVINKIKSWIENGSPND